MLEYSHNNQKGGGKRVMNIQAPSLSDFYGDKIMKFVIKWKRFTISLKGY